MGTLQSSHLTCRHQPNHIKQKILLKRNSSSLHTLHPKGFLDDNESIDRKWQFTKREDAVLKYEKLQRKTVPSDHFIIIKNMEILQFKGEDKKQESYIVKAKIEYPRNSLVQQINEKKANRQFFTETQLINILLEISECLNLVNERGIPYFVDSFTEIFYQKGKIKLSDPQLKPPIRPILQYRQNNFGKILCRIVIGLSKLEEQERIQFKDIIKFNLRYSTSFSALLFRINEGNLTLNQILMNARKLKNQKCFHEENIRHLKKEFCHRKNSQEFSYVGSMGPFYSCTQSKLNQIIKQRDFHCNSASEANLKAQKTPTSKKTSRIVKSLFNSNEKENIHQSLNSQDPNFKQDHQTKSHESILSKRNNQTKTSIEIDDHGFPKNIKLFKIKEDNSNREIAQNSKRILELNQEFLKLTNGVPIDLYQKKTELLQSVGEEEDSMIIKDISSESPVLNLQTQLEEVGQLQTQIVEENVSQFGNQHNSTIMQVTQYDSSFSKSQIKLESQFNQLSKYSNISKKSQNQEQFQFDGDIQKFSDQESEGSFIIENYEGGSKYEGKIKNGLRHGFGKLYYEDGGSYEGAWKQGQIHGFGKLYYQSGKLAYEGYWTQGEFDGEGKIINENPQMLPQNFDYHDLTDIGIGWEWYEGEFEKDKKDGFGILKLSDGCQFIGNWENNQINGMGTFILKNGTEIKGEWQDNIFVKLVQRNN